MKTVRVKVTQQHIDQGCRMHGQNCPLAQAIAAVLCPGAFICVACGVVYLNRTLTKWVDLPPEAFRFYRDFDTFGPKGMEPIEFDLDVPDEVFA